MLPVTGVCVAGAALAFLPTVICTNAFIFPTKCGMGNCPSNWLSGLCLNTDFFFGNKKTKESSHFAVYPIILALIQSQDTISTSMVSKERTGTRGGGGGMWWGEIMVP